MSWDPKQTLDSIGLERREVKRAVRVADVIMRELSMLLLTKVRDQRLLDVSLSRVVVTDDLLHAKIYFVLAPGSDRRKEAERGFKAARGFMRSHLAKALNLRYAPALHFFYDENADKVRAIEELLLDISREQRPDDSTT
ncbi:MAG: 30S ribosome-binding factor RbfA [Desulfobulbaceae bacterium]|uniref:Ribosome-binding factor A n=1 Tax=Candidatus Desulfatifera sulfidica TaxID=2841691 RepID=A0A8J6T9N1_9BACT|nr:30S ribosome-binding factor RbfA [Candidatus Desulfatifera sulfidica]